MTRRPRGRIIFATLSVVTFALTCTWTPENVSDLPYVDLSYSAPGAIHHGDGSWTVTAKARKLQGGAVGCTGNYILPEIVTRGNGTAVHYGVKFFCTSPVQFSIKVGLDNVVYPPMPAGALPPTGPPPPVRAPASERFPVMYETAGGVSAEPFKDGFSRPCIDNKNSGFEVWDQSTLGGSASGNVIDHNERSATTVVGCRTTLPM